MPNISTALLLSALFLHLHAALSWAEPLRTPATRPGTPITISAEAQTPLVRLIDRADFSPTLINIDMQNSKLEKVLAQLNEQTGLNMVVWDYRGYSQVTVRANQKPFWEVLRDLAKQLPMSPDSITVGRKCAVYVGREMGLKTLTGDGPLYVCENSRNQGKWSGNPLRKINFSISISCLADPHVWVLDQGDALRWTVTEAVDEKGYSLVDVSEGTFTSYYNLQQWLWPGGIRMKFPERGGGKMVKSLKGTISGTIVLQSARAEFDVQKSLGTPVLIEGMQVTLVKVTSLKDTTTVQVAFDQKTMAPALWKMIHQGRMAVLLKLLDSEGNEFQQHGISGTGGPQNALYSYDFIAPYPDPNVKPKKMGLPVKFVVEVPLKTKDITQKFEFKDMPMPTP